MSAIKKDQQSFKQDGKKQFSKHRNLQLLNGKKQNPSDYFYQVSNPVELAKIGQSFLEDFKQGVRSFAISSTDYKSSQQRTVLALTCYFDHMFDMKILIISDFLNQGVFTDIMKARTTESTQIPNTEKKIEVNHFHHHFDLIDLNNIVNLNDTGRQNYEFEQAIQNLLNSYDLIFWDTPTIANFKNNGAKYNPTLNFYESLTIIVSQSVTQSKDVNEMRDYFSSFGVNIKGVLFDNLEAKKVKEKKKKRWSIFS